jgi:hypothetical protein
MTLWRQIKASVAILLLLPLALVIAFMIGVGQLGEWIDRVTLPPAKAIMDWADR